MCQDNVSPCGAVTPRGWQPIVLGHMNNHSFFVKECKSCGISKPVSDFHVKHKNSPSLSKWASSCRECDNKRRRLANKRVFRVCDTCGEGKWLVAGRKSSLSPSCSSCTSARVGRSRATHGLAGTHLYQSWADMKRRCLDPSRGPSYAGRGISYCPEWQNFEPFMKWALANGYKEGLTIDRKNVDEGYEPSNCRWVPMSTNQLTKQNCLSREDVLEIHALANSGEFNLEELASRFNISTAAVSRVKNKRTYLEYFDCE